MWLWWNIPASTGWLEIPSFVLPPIAVDSVVMVTTIRFPGRKREREKRDTVQFSGLSFPTDQSGDLQTMTNPSLHCNCAVIIKSTSRKFFPDQEKIAVKDNRKKKTAPFRPFIYLRTREKRRRRRRARLIIISTGQFLYYSCSSYFRRRVVLFAPASLRPIDPPWLRVPPPRVRLGVGEGSWSSYVCKWSRRRPDRTETNISEGSFFFFLPIDISICWAATAIQLGNQPLTVCCTIDSLLLGRPSAIGEREKKV